MLTCKICTREFEKLAKAHVIPRSFFHKMRGDAKYTVVLEARPDKLDKIPKQSGIYDQKIICQECEKIFGDFDKHGFEVLSKSRGDEDAYRDPEGNLCGVYLRGADYRKLKLFVLSVLWRAHVSSLEFFSRVDLGPHADVILQTIQAGQELPAETYATMLILPIGQSFPGTILRPWSTKFEGVRFYTLYLPDIKILVKVDKRPTPPDLKVLQLRPDVENVMAFLPFRDSSEHRYIEGFRSFVRHHSLTNGSRKHGRPRSLKGLPLK